MVESDNLDTAEGPELWDQVFARIIMDGGDPCIYVDLPLGRVEEVEKYYLSLAKPGSSMRHMTHFEGWFYEHCMGRQVSPVEALESFRLSASSSVRAIAIKALRDRYGITESERQNQEMAEVNKSISHSTRQTMLAMWVTAAATIVAAAAALMQYFK